MPVDRGARFGHYEIAALIGVGGMGEVYRAADTNLKRDVALKVLPESFLTDAGRVARLQREAELLASLNHANIAQIYGLERSDGRTALVMELVDGPTLAERIANGPLPPSEALDVARQIAAALEAAHERGIVHRDLKPANIKLKPDGTVKVLDFGIAKALDARTTSGAQPQLVTPTMTEAGVLLGTAAYMAPEQARGKSVDRRADVWAFGCVLYEMLTGKAAFLGDDVTDTLARVLEREPGVSALPSGLPATVRPTLELCLQKDPKNRLHDIGDVRLALDGRLAAVSAQPATRVPLWRRTLPAAAALLVGALGAGAYFAGRVTPAPATGEQTAPRVTRFTVTPPASAPLANLGGYDVVISPDGRRLAYYAQNTLSGNVSIYVRDLDGLDARLVPETEVGIAGGNMNPFFSSDGKSIGFWAPERGVVRVSLDGGPPIKIVDTPSRAPFLGAVWAGDEVIYSNGFALQRVSASGAGKSEPLTEEIADGVVASPTLLPGGRGVLFGQVRNGVERVAVLDLDSGKQKILVEGGQNPSYSPSGHVLFARGTTLMAVPFDPKELTVTGDAVAMIQDVRHPNSQTAADYALSASGTLAYVPNPSGSDARSTIVWVDRRGRVLGPVVSESLDNPRDPVLSPDGTRLVLATGPASDGDLWAYDLRGRPPIRLAVNGDVRSPVWSPDGRRIVFTSLNLPDGGLDETAADGSMPAPRRVRDIPALVRSWSTAGELLFVQLLTGDIEAMPATGADAPHKVVATEYAEMDPALSPDGRWLAYVSNRTGRNEVWVQGYPDGVVVRISTNSGFEPRWSADGRELYYIEANPQGISMMAVSVQTSGELSFDTPVELFRGPYAATPAPVIQTYDVARDGRFVMVEQPGADARSAPSSIVVVENFAEELRRRVPSK